jgi:hypothetical protein
LRSPWPGTLPRHDVTGLQPALLNAARPEVHRGGRRPPLACHRSQGQYGRNILS